MPRLQSSAAPDPWIGRVVDDRYRVMACIGRGGMGAVYKVVHTHMGKVAAMKLLHGSLARDRELVKRFHQEATAISRLDHPNIVQVFDFGRVADSMFLVMEYLKGEDLSRILRRDGPLPVPRCLPILVQVCNALTEAHETGVVHRDLKPENIRVARTREGLDFIKVLDFGLAKLLGDGETEPERDRTGAPITARGSLVGTPYYMAPEMIRARPTDHRVDIYSLGAMAYRMLTAQNAFMAKTPMAVLTKHITEELVPPSRRAPDLGIPRQVDAVVMRAMAKDPDRRYQSAAAVKHDLRQIMQQLSLQDTSTPYLDDSLPTVSPSPVRRREADWTGVQSAVDEGALRAPVMQRLSKEDLAFERKLRRGRYVQWVMVLVLLGGVAAAAYWFKFRPHDEGPPTVEVEPNNEPDNAVVLLADRPVTGKLGKRLTPEASDRDWYRLEVTGQGPQVLQARVTGIPNMDILLELFDAAGGKLAQSDTSARGGHELFPRWVVSPGRHYLLVREVWVDGVPPIENVTDTYAVVARWRPADDGWELEPNDTVAKAHPLSAGQSVKGFLASVADVDRYVLPAQKGVLAGMVSAVEGVDLVLEVERRRDRKPVVIDQAGAGAGERFNKIRVKGQGPVYVTVRRKDPAKPPPGQDARGCDSPYTLKVWLLKGTR